MGHIGLIGRLGLIGRCGHVAGMGRGLVGPIPSYGSYMSDRSYILLVLFLREGSFSSPFPLPETVPFVV